MSNNIPIDDLFREKLSGGKEQLNLGAWANMERMLNGQNPYATPEEPKRKKRILPFMIFFVLLTASVSAGLLLLNNGGDHSQNSSLPNDMTSNNNKAELAASSVSPDKTNSNTPNQINLQPEINKSQSAANQYIAGKTNRKNQQLTAADASTNTESNQEAGTRNALPGNSKSRNINKEPLIASNNPDKGAFQKKSFAQYNEPDATLLAANPASVGTDMPKANAGITAPKTKVESIPVKRTVTNVSEAKNRDGSTNKIVIDTVEEYMAAVERRVPIADPVADNVIRDKNYKWHPRYVVGSEDYVAEQQLVLNSQSAAVAAPEPKTPTLQTASDEKDRKSKNDKKTVIATLGAFAGATIAKIGESGGNFFRMFGVLDPGISLGVNAALFNTKHNYGGFHGGLTNHTSISETFSIISELKFFIRNNSGFTINDIKTVLKNTNVDPFSIADSTIYTYTIDSSTKRYNFKSFMSLELPVLLNARFNNLSVYGGPNFVYNMKLKISEINKTYIVNKEVALPSASTFNFPYDEEKSLQYTRNDFGARFGIGYAVGLSYNFNPNIYLDLRMSKVMWDNTKTNTQREISNGVTKVPFTQLSLGYRFKNRK